MSKRCHRMHHCGPRADSTSLLGEQIDYCMRLSRGRPRRLLKSPLGLHQMSSAGTTHLGIAITALSSSNRLIRRTCSCCRQSLRPTSVATREFTRLLTSRAMLKLHSGNPDAAWDDIRALHRTSRYLSHSYTLWDFRVAVAVSSFATKRAMAPLLCSPDLTPGITVSDSKRPLGSLTEWRECCGLNRHHRAFHGARLDSAVLPASSRRPFNCFPTPLETIPGTSIPEHSES